MTCEGCIYHDPGDEGSKNIAPQSSRCRRYAPRNISGTGTGYAIWEWPATDGKGCGEKRNKGEVLSPIEYQLSEINRSLERIADFTGRS